MMMLTQSIAPSRSEIGGRDGLARQRGRAARERDTALLQTKDLCRRVERRVDVLLDNDEGAPLRDDRRQAGIEVAHYDRSQAEAELITQEKARIRHQRAADRRHLLLAAGESGDRQAARLRGGQE